MAQSPAPGAALFTPKGEAAETGARISGFRSFAGQFMRMDIAERLVRLAHEKMEKGEAFTPEDPQIVSLGLSGQGFAQLMRGAGFRPAVSQGPSDANWAFCRSEEHTSELQSLMRISYAVFCLQKKKKIRTQT